MAFLIFFAFSLFLLIIFLDRYMMHKAVKNKLQKILNLEEKIVLIKENVKSETFTVGLKNHRYHFRKSDLYFFDNAFVIIGFYKIVGVKTYTCIIVFSDGNDLDTKDLKTFNLNSSNNDIYIEFGKASFTSTNVSVRLKNISKEEKQLIKIK